VHVKTGPVVFGDKLADRQTDTDMLITIFCSRSGGGVVEVQAIMVADASWS